MLSEILSHFNGGELIGLVAVSGGLLCGIISIAIGGMYKIRQLGLKEAMVQRGMSAEEICAVLGSGSCKEGKNASQS